MNRVETHCSGFGAAVIELLHDLGIKTPVVRIGWPDEFVEHGNIPALRKKHGITVDAAVEKILSALGDPLPPKGVSAEKRSAATLG